MPDPAKKEDPTTKPGKPSAEDERMKRSAESGEGDVPPRDLPEEPEPLEEDLPSNRAQERGGP